MPATWQAGDTLPPIRFTITVARSITEDRAPMDLTTVAVMFRFGPKGGQATLEGPCTVDEPLAGTCHYDWAKADLAESGEFEGQLVLTFLAEDPEDPPLGVQLSPPFEIVVARSMAVAPAPGG